MKKTSAMRCPHCGRSFLADRIEQHIQTTHPSPADPIVYLQELLQNSTIQSLYRSACDGERRRLRRATFSKFQIFENDIRQLNKLYAGQAAVDELAKAQAICVAIRKSLTTGRIQVMARAGRKRSASSERLVVYPGGAPGLGKRS